jgi:DNA-binding Lrp family transcriptional regulator
MDSMDRKITQCLVYDGRATFRRIADVLGISEQTVARRYRALCDSGALRVQVRANEHALGLRRWFVRIQCRPNAAAPLAEALAVRDDVGWVNITSGGSEVVCVAFSSRDGVAGSVLDRLPRTSQVLGFTAFAVLHTHIGDATKWTAFDEPLAREQFAALTVDKFAPPSKTVRPTSSLVPEDDRLLRELADDGRATIATLARVTGRSQAAVSARLDELLLSGAVYVGVDIAPATFGFDVTAYLWLTVVPGKLHSVGKKLSLLPETTYTAAVSGPANLMVTVACQDLADLYTLVTEKIGALSAIRQVEVVPVLRRFKQGGTRLADQRLLSRA